MQTLLTLLLAVCVLQALWLFNVVDGLEDDIVASGDPVPIVGKADGIPTTSAINAEAPTMSSEESIHVEAASELVKPLALELEDFKKFSVSCCGSEILLSYHNQLYIRLRS